jgi:hypothetical protein
MHQKIVLTTVICTSVKLESELLTEVFSYKWVTTEFYLVYNWAANEISQLQVNCNYDYQLQVGSQLTLF